MVETAITLIDRWTGYYEMSCSPLDCQGFICGAPRSALFGTGGISPAPRCDCVAGRGYRLRLWRRSEVGSQS